MGKTAVRLALVGLGGVCEAVHYNGFSRIAGVELVGICDPHRELLYRRREEWGIAAAYEDLAIMLADQSPDAVVVATPNVYHKPLIIQALKAGCHVLCEKPLALNLGETEELYAAASGAGVRHMVAFTYRFVPAMTYLQHLVDSGELGEIRHARFQRLQDWGEHAIGWRQYEAQAGTGELADMGIHRIDLAQNLMGPIAAVCAGMKQLLPRDTSADGTPCLPQDVEDWAAWIAEFSSGADGRLRDGQANQGTRPCRRPRPGRTQRNQSLGRLSTARATRNPHRRSRRTLPGATRPRRVLDPTRFAARSRRRQPGRDFSLGSGVGVHLCDSRGARMRPQFSPWGQCPTGGGLDRRRSPRASVDRHRWLLTRALFQVTRNRQMARSTKPAQRATKVSPKRT